MTNPCRQHFLRVTAARQAAVAAPGQPMADSSAYTMQMAQLHHHHQQLRGIQSTQGKEELKAKLLPDYAPYIDGVLAGGQGAQDVVVSTIMLWRFDAGDFEGGLQIAAYVLKHGLEMSDNFARKPPCLIAEVVAEAALKAARAGEAFDIGVIAEADRLTAEHDMPDEVRAKVKLAIGLLAAGMVDDKEAKPDDVQCLEVAQYFIPRAIELHERCGGKKALERVERLLKKHAGPAS